MKMWKRSGQAGGIANAEFPERKKIEKDTSLPVYIQTVKGVGYRFNGKV